MTRGSDLKAIIKRQGMAILPGVYDALGARLCENAGFDGVYITGAGLHGSLLGVPDVDLLTQTEMTDQARRIANAVSSPVLADAEGGFGDALNTRRTVQIFESAGVAGVHIDDQVLPSKCPWLFPQNRTPLIPIEEMQKKIEAAVNAREDEDFLIIARSDTQGSVYDTGDFGHLDEQIKRLNAYVEAGADAVFPVAPHFEGYKRVLDSVDAPIKLCSVAKFSLPAYDLHEYTPDDFRELGCSLMILPALSLTAATKAIVDTLERFKVDQLVPADLQMSFEEYSELVEYPGLAALK
jgi:2-methylisocitrate lyase-like PEP mutase family enzyme